MIISDKQELRRCVKRIVRRADVVEASLDFDVSGGEMGVEALLDALRVPAFPPEEAMRRMLADGTPLGAEAAAVFAALDALELPVHDLNRAQELQRSYERDAYLREVLDAMHARQVLVRVPASKAADVQFADDRLSALIVAEEDGFAPGRYGVDYQGAARKLADAAAAAGARHVMLPVYDEQALRYCMMPLCEDTGCALHICLRDAVEIDAFAQLMDEFTGVRALVWSVPEAERRLIGTAATRPRMLVRLADTSHIGMALSRLGTRFVPYASGAALPEMMLGGWIAAREEIIAALCGAYLPLARAGFQLQSAAIESDVERLLCGNMLSLASGAGQG